MRVEIPWTKYLFNPEDLISEGHYSLAKKDPELFVSAIKGRLKADSIEGMRAHQNFLLLLGAALALAIITAVLGWYIFSVFITLFFIYSASVFLTTGSFWLFALKRYNQAKAIVVASKDHDTYEKFSADPRIRENNYGILDAVAWLRTAGQNFE